MGFPGIAGFESHYSRIYGSRWQGISKALKSDTLYTTLIPPFISKIPEQSELEGVEPCVTSEELEGVTYYRATDLPFCYEAVEYRTCDPDCPDPTDIELFDKLAVFNSNSFVSRLSECAYTMEYAVAFACYSLGVKPGDKVLDMFSHTGGHSLIFSSLLFYEASQFALLSDGTKSTTEVVEMINKLKDKNSPIETALLVCSESRKTMHDKSVDMLKKYLPEKLLNSMCVQTVSYDPEDANLSRFGTFNRIFVRMPQLFDNACLSKWSERAVKQNSTKALTVLNSASKLLKEGGSIIYCNHSFDPLDNELVIHTLLKSRPGLREEPIDLEATIATLQERLIWKAQLPGLPKAETRTYGCALMPDDTPCGPLYICKLVSVNR
ncbi:hypothetical protein BgAZ_203070 [Babesia gibsoni]|uniref:SAM-dependent MTase RsmB/NOP-type domain-containing protein n=1 Tax=Babesia gibsoni TaxID=33632 RepID=A0AAD8PE74_BABGI|nr:hypothetical protein BgAZ_203070 [Babesia gibsoni]